MMLLKLRKKILKLKPTVLDISWYPNSKSCVSGGNRRPRMEQMPPLMVRKPEWRG